MPRKYTFVTVTSCTESPFNVPTLLLVMMPLRAATSAPPTDIPLNDGLSPSSVRAWIVTLLACTRHTLLARVHGAPPPPAPTQSGFDPAGRTPVEPWPAPTSV